MFATCLPGLGPPAPPALGRRRPAPDRRPDLAPAAGRARPVDLGRAGTTADGRDELPRRQPDPQRTGVPAYRPAGAVEPGDTPGPTEVAVRRPGAVGGLGQRVPGGSLRRRAAAQRRPDAPTRRPRRRTSRRAAPDR